MYIMSKTDFECKISILSTSHSFINPYPPRGVIGASFAQKCLYWALEGLFDPFQLPLPLHYVVSEVLCKCQTIRLHHDDLKQIPPKGVDAAVPRKVSTLPEVGHKIFWRTRLGSFFSLHHGDSIPPLF
jgi:hypothetical protein